MKIFDCFMYFNEDVVLDVRFNYLDKFVDKFVIVESTYNHRGQKKKLNFNINNFLKFKDKIEYLILDSQSPDIETINEADNENEKSRKYILNGYRRDHFQRNYLSNGIRSADKEDLIIISDIDEIPNLKTIDITKIGNGLIFLIKLCVITNLTCFKRIIIGLVLGHVKKKNLISPQWLRDIKPKNYSKWRIDTYFSKNKYNNISFIKKGGWHFSYLNTPELIEQKLKSYTHHREYDLNPIGIKNIEDRIKNKESVYNLSSDKRKNQFLSGVKLEILSPNYLPKYIEENKEKYKNWLAK